MNKNIYFVTTNEVKFAEISRWVKELNPNISIEQLALDIPEIQSLDVTEVSIAKAKEAWSKLKKPLLIDDGGLYLEKYKLFPGTFSKHIYECLGLEGILHLAHDNKNATFINCLVYITGPENYQTFLGITKGKLIEPQGDVQYKRAPFNQFFVPEGSDKCFLELKGTEEEKKFHYRYNSLKNFINWLKRNEHPE